MAAYKYVTYGKPQRVPCNAKTVAMKKITRKLMGFRRG